MKSRTITTIGAAAFFAAAAVLSVPALAAPALPGSPCEHAAAPRPGWSMIRFSAAYQVTPVRVIALTWSCRQDQVPAAFRRYVDTGNWSAPLPAVLLVTGHSRGLPPPG
jgi:hypothetical protein